MVGRIARTSPARLSRLNLKISSQKRSERGKRPHSMTFRLLKDQLVWGGFLTKRISRCCRNARVTRRLKGIQFAELDRRALRVSRGWVTPDLEVGLDA